MSDEVTIYWCPLGQHPWSHATEFEVVEVEDWPSLVHRQCERHYKEIWK